MTKLTVVTDGAYGSCGKGHATGWLARRDPNPSSVVAIRVGGSNAGHTTHDPITGQRWSLRHIPVVAVTDRYAKLVIAAGSEIDPQVLGEELQALDKNGYSVSDRLFIDARAVVVTDDMKKAEMEAGLTVDSGNSTGKGVGAARAARAMRTAERVGSWNWGRGMNLNLINTDQWYPDLLSRNKVAHLMIEGIQGHGLSVYGEHYPKCTSGGTDLIDLLAMARINPWQLGLGAPRVVVVMRTRPIRIAGNSGQMLGETSWSALGLEDEITTVTKKVRRVGEWDPDLAASAMKANGGTIWLSMADQLDPEVAGATRWEQLSLKVLAFIARVEQNTGARVDWVGTGPHSVVPRQQEDQVV